MMTEFFGYQKRISTSYFDDFETVVWPGYINYIRYYPGSMDTLKTFNEFFETHFYKDKIESDIFQAGHSDLLKTNAFLKHFTIAKPELFHKSHQLILDKKVPSLLADVSAEIKRISDQYNIPKEFIDLFFPAKKNTPRPDMIESPFVRDFYQSLDNDVYQEAGLTAYEVVEKFKFLYPDKVKEITEIILDKAVVRVKEIKWVDFIHQIKKEGVIRNLSSYLNSLSSTQKWGWEIIGGDQLIQMKLSTIELSVEFYKRYPHLRNEIYKIMFDYFFKIINENIYPQFFTRGDRRIKDTDAKVTHFYNFVAKNRKIRHFFRFNGKILELDLKLEDIVQKVMEKRLVSRMKKNFSWPF